MAIRNNQKAVILLDENRDIVGVFSSLKILTNILNEICDFASYSKLSKFKEDKFTFKANNGRNYFIEIVTSNELAKPI